MLKEVGMGRENIKSQKEQEKEFFDKTYNFILAEINSGLGKEEIIQKLVDAEGMDKSYAQELVYSLYDRIIKQARQEEFDLSCLGPSCLGGGLAALVGGILWGLVVILTNYEIGYMAIGIGVLCGYAVVLFAKGKKGFPLQMVATVASILGIIIGKYAIFYHYVKEHTLKEYGADFASKVSAFSSDLLKDFIDEGLLSMLSGFDILWVILAIAAAWSIPKSRLILNKKDAAKKQLVATVVLIVLIAAGISSYFLSNKGSDHEISSEYTSDSYASQKYGYSIKAAEGWQLVEKKHFSKIDKSWLEAGAESVIVRDDQMAYCFLIPEQLDGYGIFYNIEDIKNGTLENIKINSKSAKVITSKTIAHEDGGFEIQYSELAEGVTFQYLILYFVHNQTGIQLLTWTAPLQAESLFNEVRGFLKDISFGDTNL